MSARLDGDEMESTLTEREILTIMAERVEALNAKVEAVLAILAPSSPDPIHKVLRFSR